MSAYITEIKVVTVQCSTVDINYQGYIEKL